MISLPTAHLVPGRGIEGDRFAGSRSTRDEDTYEATLVEQEALEALWNQQPSVEQGGSARRTIVVRDYPLSALTGRTFRIEGVTLCGLARHGARFSQERTQANACASSYGADLGAQLLTEGVIAVSDLIQEVP